MSSKVSQLAKDLQQVMEDKNKRKTSPIDTKATVVDVEDDIVWVHFPGGVEKTPVSRTINAKPGDVVQVRASDGRAWLVGNNSSPPTDDSVANQAIENTIQIENEIVEVNKYFVNEIEAQKATIGELEADTAKIHNLTAEELSATVGYIDDLITGNISAENIIADHAVVDDLDVQSIEAATGYIGSLTAGNISAQDIISDHGTIETLDSNYAHITNGVIDNASIDYADVDNLDTHYAEIDLANVNNAWIQNGVIKDAAISNEMVNSISANKLTAGTIDASNITVTNLNASNITTGSITVDGITIDVTNNEASIDGSYIEDGTITMNGLSQNVKDVIDGAIETFTGTVVPTLNNSPASSWTTTALKDQHIGDVYYVVNSQSQQNGYCYRFTKSGSTYSWQLIKDSDVTAALARLTEVEGDIADIESFDETIATFKTETEGAISTLQTKTTSLETSLGDKVDTSTFNELSQTVEGNSSSITTLSTITTNNGLTTSTNITNTVNTVSQTASGNSSKISQLTTTLGTNADGTTKAGDIMHRASAIEQDLDGFKSTVSQTYQTKADMSNYSTVSDMESAISQSASAITQSVSETYATKTALADKADADDVYTKTEADELLDDKADSSDLTSLEGRVTTAEGTITTQAGQISLKANASDVYTKQAANALLEVKANKDTLTSEINASADTVKINANRLNITGVITAINDDSTTTIDGGKISTGSILVGALDDGVQDILTNADNTLIYDHTYEYNTSNGRKVSATFTAYLYKGGVDIKTDYDPTCFAWYLKKEDTDGVTKETLLGTGYTITVTLANCGYGAEIVGRCTIADDSEALSVNNDNLTSVDNETLTVRASGDAVRVRDLSVVTTIFPTDKIMIVGASDEHLVSVQTLQDYLDIHLDQQVLFNTTAGWNAQTSLVSDANTLYVYTDHATDSNNNNVAGIKAGDGLAYVVDLPFIDAVATEHIADNTRHITAEERAAWNNKVRCYYAGTENLVFTTA